MQVLLKGSSFKPSSMFLPTKNTRDASRGLHLVGENTSNGGELGYSMLCRDAYLRQQDGTFGLA